MNEELSYKKIFQFWFPLSATWLMMAVEGPFLTALIARFTDPEYNLAAYGVAFSIALIIESPVILLLSASTALVENKETFQKLKRFVYFLSASTVISILILLIPAIYNFITLELIKLPQRVADLNYYALVVLIPWAPSIGYRRFYQGIMIRSGKTKLVAYGTVIRLMAMGLTGTFLYTSRMVDGVMIGACALSAGVITEAIATRLMVGKLLVSFFDMNSENKKNITQKEILKFYYPLALTSFISLGVHPIVTFFMGQSRMSLESLAVLPVLHGLVFIFRSFGLSYQEVGIALIKSQKEYVKLRNFAYGMAVAVFTALGLIALTPLSMIWLIEVAGLTPKLAEFARIPLIIYAFFPITTVWINFQRSVLVNTRHTEPITMATVLEVLGIILVLIVFINYLSIVGAVAAVSAYTFGRLAANLYLIKPFRKCVGKIPH
jgi:Na+-driven multidrug efflux pump